MNISKIIALYFSPNGRTKEIVNKIAKGIGDYEIEEVDLTSKQSRMKQRHFNKDELVVMGFPVYGDRLPALSDEVFKRIKGNNTPAVAIVSYGNKDYGDALLELQDKLKRVNMKTITGAAVIGEHCLNKDIASGRPDEEDNSKILEYAARISSKIKEIVDIESAEDIFVKGNYPYRTIKPQPVSVGDSKCIQCGKCEKGCPVKAIDEHDFRKTNSDLCIFCGYCINVCPTGSRDIKQESLQDFLKKLQLIAGQRKEIEVFF